MGKWTKFGVAVDNTINQTRRGESFVVVVVVGEWTWFEAKPNFMGFSRKVAIYLFNNEGLSKSGCSWWMLI